MNGTGGRMIFGKIQTFRFLFLLIPVAFLLVPAQNKVKSGTVDITRWFGLTKSIE